MSYSLLHLHLLYLVSLSLSLVLFISYVQKHNTELVQISIYLRDFRLLPRCSSQAFVLLRCYAAQVGTWLPTDRNNLSIKGQAVQEYTLFLRSEQPHYVRVSKQKLQDG